MSQTETRYFRDCVICYVNYKENGEIEPVHIDAEGVRLPSTSCGMQ